MPAFYHIFKKSLIICLIITSQSIFANANTQNFENVLQTVQEKKLYQHTTWQRMLYYDNLSQSRVLNRFNSDKNIQDFFVSPQGATNPQSEMTAMLQALLAENDSKLGNFSVQCRFPARTYWLKQQLNLTFSPAYCQDFDNWLKKINPQSVSLVFTDEYFDNPASAFAHIFLKFDNGSGDEYYFNYTPKTSKEDNIAKLAYKTMISGNAGEFTINHYNNSINKYLNDEKRDVWQYSLNLDKEQVLQLARQVYEIKNQTLPYFLFDENCASEILTLLNTLFPNKNYLANPSVMIAPSQIIRQLNDDGLITEEKFTPANQPLSKNSIAENFSQNNPRKAHALSRLSVGVSSNNEQNATQIGYRLVYHDMLDKPVGYRFGKYLTGLDIGVEIGEKHNQLTHATLINMQNFKPLNLTKEKSEKSWSVDVGLEQVVDNLDNHEHLVGNVKLGYGISQAVGKQKNNLCYQLGTLATQVGKGLDTGYRVGIGADVGCVYQFDDNLRGLASVSLPYWVGKNVWQPNIALGVQYDIGKNQAIRLNAEKHWIKNKTLDDKIAISYLKYFE